MIVGVAELGDNRPAGDRPRARGAAPTSFTAVDTSPYPVELLLDRVPPAGNTRGQNRKVAMQPVFKAVYTSLSVATSVAGGMLAGEVFNQTWAKLNEPHRSNHRPATEGFEAARPARRWSPPGLQGLLFGVVRAAVDRAGARSYQAVTHESPVSQCWRGHITARRRT